jgi:hypothetical protein
MLLQMTKVLVVLKRMPSSVLGNHLHERSLLHLRGSDLLQIEGWSHLGVHLTHHLGVVLILHQFVADLILLLSGVVTHLLAGDHYLHLGGGLLLHHEGIGHRCGLHLGGVVVAHHHADAPLGLLGGDHHLQGG